MGACRETKNLFFYLKKQTYLNNKRDWEGFWRHIRHFDKITFEDTFMPIVCKLFGHKPYQPEPKYEPNEWACTRCHRFIEREKVV